MSDLFPENLWTIQLFVVWNVGSASRDGQLHGIDPQIPQSEHAGLCPSPKSVRFALYFRQIPLLKFQKIKNCESRCRTFFSLIYRNELFKRVGPVVWSIYWLTFFFYRFLIWLCKWSIVRLIDWLIDCYIDRLLDRLIDWLIVSSQDFAAGLSGLLSHGQRGTHAGAIRGRRWADRLLLAQSARLHQSRPHSQ